LKASGADGTPAVRTTGAASLQELPQLGRFLFRVHGAIVQRVDRIDQHGRLVHVLRAVGELRFVGQ
jgi:hypothetical protein